MSSTTARQLQAIDSHCFHMQLLATTFLFTIILVALEDSISENTETMIALAISLTECQEALSERQFEKRVILTLSGADVHARSVGINS